MMEGKEFDSFMRFKTFLDQYSKENNTVYCIADSRTAQYSTKRLPKDSKPFPTKFKYSYANSKVCLQTAVTFLYKWLPGSWRKIGLPGVARQISSYLLFR